MWKKSFLWQMAGQEKQPYNWVLWCRHKASWTQFRQTLLTLRSLLWLMALSKTVHVLPNSNSSEKNPKISIWCGILFPIEMKSYSYKLPWIKIHFFFIFSDFNWVYSIGYTQHPANNSLILVWRFFLYWVFHIAFLHPLNSVRGFQC